MTRPTPELAARIQHLIDELKPSTFGDWPLRVCRDDLHALPLHGNRIFLWALRPDGEVLCMDHEAWGHPTEPETDPLILYAVLLHAARRHPELQELVPPRPATAKQCDRCGGVGSHERQDGGTGSSESCMGCSGLGWFTKAQ
jgi:hypothetical protein